MKNDWQSLSPWQYAVRSPENKMLDYLEHNLLATPAECAEILARLEAERKQAKLERMRQEWMEIGTGEN